jgi:hypothetical protein
MKLCESNPHYVEIDGRPTLLVGSGEHYGALLNADFDYPTYFEILGKLGLNQVRVFSGTYREGPGHFLIESNTLAPEPGRFISPWKETSRGAFDLATPNPVWSRRLADLLSHAATNNVIVELVLFCFWYSDDHWGLSPMHPTNNTGGLGPTNREVVFSLTENELLPIQEEFVRRTVREVNGFDNVYFEICNEPYSRHDSTAYMEWQHHMVELIAATESELPKRHLIALNYQNRTLVIPEVHPEVSILNFHYALPEAVLANAHFQRPIGDDETGFSGQTPEPYRREAWRFLLSGGGIFSHLDYSFTCEHPDGSATIEGKTPGYGGADLREQLAFLRRFLETNGVYHLRPANEIFAGVDIEFVGRAVCDPGRLYLVYLPDIPRSREIALHLPFGRYAVSWINPMRCTEEGHEEIEVTSKRHALEIPDRSGDAAVRVERL